MQTRSFLLTSGFSLVATLCGCGSNPPAETPSNSTSETTSSESAGATSNASDTTPQITSDTTTSSKPKPQTVDDCKALAASSTGEDTTAVTQEGGTGQSDRLAPMNQLIKEKRPGFRCCFDIWAGKIPQAKLYTKVKLTLELNPKGELKKASAAPEEGGPPVATEVEGCLIDVATSLTYPKSTSGKDTVYTYPFDFKPRF